MRPTDWHVVRHMQLLQRAQKAQGSAIVGATGVAMRAAARIMPTGERTHMVTYMPYSHAGCSHLPQGLWRQGRQLPQPESHVHVRVCNKHTTDCQARRRVCIHCINSQSAVHIKPCRANTQQADPAQPRHALRTLHPNGRYDRQVGIKAVCRRPRHSLPCRTPTANCSGLPTKRHC
jgi:hypothetical protein